MTKNKKSGGVWRGLLIKIKNVIGFILPVVIIILVFDNLGFIYGTIGLIGLFSCLAIYKLIKGRVMFLQTLKTIEGMIWGKPLDKDMWNKGELKHTKVKIKWRRKKKNATIDKER